MINTPWTVHGPIPETVVRRSLFYLAVRKTPKLVVVPSTVRETLCDFTQGRDLAAGQPHLHQFLRRDGQQGSRGGQRAVEEFQQPVEHASGRTNRKLLTDDLKHQCTKGVHGRQVC